MASGVSRRGWLINLLYIILIIAFIRTVTLKRGSSGSGNFTQFDASGIFHVFIYE